MLTKAVGLPLAESISQIFIIWQKLTLNQDILSVVKGYTKLFIKIPFQQKIPNFPNINQKQIALVDLELKDILRKGAFQEEFLSNLLFVGKNDGGHHSVINLKMLRHNHISPAEFGIYNKCKEINFALMSEIEFLGIEMDSVKITFSLTTEKVQTLLELTKFVGLLSSILQAVEPTKIQLRFLQHLNIVCLSKKNELLVSNDIKHHVNNRINLMDRKRKVLRLPNFFSVEPANDYPTSTSLIE